MAGAVRPEAVAPLLRGRFGHPYTYIRTCASTQHVLGDDAPEGAVAVADHQTEGRGRLGREWRAPPETSLLFSIILRPHVSGDRLPELTIVAAEAVAEAIAAETGVEAATKFPNDVLIGERKVAGVLAEASDGRVVLGIGVNVSQREHELPSPARLPPTSLELATHGSVDRARLLATLLGVLERRYDEWRGLSA
jgi:BirA family biotin operon repressor/biotin-[acetyl-CoA-carboxylase] ligase